MKPLFTSLVVRTLAGCIAGALACPGLVAARGADQPEVTRLVITPFGYVTAPGEITPDPALRDAVNRRFFERLTQRLAKTRAIEVVASDAGLGDTGTLVVEGVFTSLDAGAEPERRVFGFGSANVHVAVKVTVRDAHSGELVTEFARRRSFRLGFLNSTDRGLLMREARSLASELADFLEARVAREHN